MKRREKEFRERKREKPRERSIWKERVHRETRIFESETRGSQTRESRREDATNAGFDTRVQVRARGERGCGLGSASRYLEKNTDAGMSSASC